jgi:tetrahydromethanopterin S-methyltransferase subunit G
LSVVAEAMLSRVLEEAVNRIARKVAEGKKLSDQEIVMLYLDIIMRSNERRFESIEKRIDDLKGYVDKRVNDLKESVDKRFESIEKRIDDLKGYVDKRVNDLKESVDKRFESIEKRIDDLKGYVDKRFESIEKRIDLVYSEVSSIKTDIIKLMKEYMEMLYGGKKD